MANPSASRPLSTLEATQGQISSQSSTDATLREVAFEWELTKGTIYLPLGCLQVDFLLLPLLDGPLFRTSCRLGTSNFLFDCIPPTVSYETIRRQGYLAHKKRPQQAALCAPSAPGDSDEEDAPSSEPGALEAPYGIISQNVFID